MGLPAYEDYYVTHTLGEQDTMSFVPHRDSKRDELKPNTTERPAPRTFKVKMESENTDDAELIALLIAILLFLAVAGITVFITL